LQSRGWRLPAHEIEKLVLTQVAGILRDRGALLDVLPSKRKSPDLVSAALARAAKLADACEAGSLASQAEVVAALVRRVAVAQDKVMIEAEQKSLTACLLDQGAAQRPERKAVAQLRSKCR